MKNYMDIINAETELLKKKRKLELDYEREMKAIEKRLAEYEEYKNDFKNIQRVYFLRIVVLLI